MTLTWFGHSAFRIEAGASIILIDPFLSGNPVFHGDVAAASKGATHIIITHGHDDHIGDAPEIEKRTNAQVISNFEICRYLNSKGAQNINPGNSGGTVPCGGFSVSFTKAFHSSATVVDGQPTYLGNPNGIVIKHPGSPVLYHMGDTDIFGDMALIDELHHPKIGIVPIGDRFTMGAESAALAVKRYFHFDVVVPCHYATFDVLAPNADGFVKAVGRQGPKVIVPLIGDPVSL